MHRASEKVSKNTCLHKSWRLACTHCESIIPRAGCSDTLTGLGYPLMLLLVFHVHVYAFGMGGVLGWGLGGAAH